MLPDKHQHEAGHKADIKYTTHDKATTDMKGKAYMHLVGVK